MVVVFAIVFLHIYGRFFIFFAQNLQFVNLEYKIPFFILISNKTL